MRAQVNVIVKSSTYTQYCIRYIYHLTFAALQSVIKNQHTVYTKSWQNINNNEIYRDNVAGVHRKPPFSSSHIYPFYKNVTRNTCGG